jgi:hypothetical protein
MFRHNNNRRQLKMKEKQKKRINKLKKERGEEN